MSNYKEFDETTSYIKKGHFNIEGQITTYLYLIAKYLAKITDTLENEETGYWIPQFPHNDERDDQKCSRCGSIYPGATKFCPDCGKKMVRRDKNEI